MPPRPFPFPLRVGTDIVRVNRIREAITRNRKTGSQLHPFLNKLLTRREQQVFFRMFPDFHVTDTTRLPRVSEHLAGRFAAKEAAIKAAKPRKLVYLDIEVLRQGETGEMYGLIRDNTFVHERHGIKRLNLKETAASGSSTAETATEYPFASRKEIPEESDHDPAGQMVALSISHEGEYATATCIAPLGEVPGDVGGEAAARMYDATQDDNAFWKQ